MICTTTPRDKSTSYKNLFVIHRSDWLWQEVTFLSQPIRSVYDKNYVEIVLNPTVTESTSCHSHQIGVWQKLCGDCTEPYKEWLEGEADTHRTRILLPWIIMEKNSTVTIVTVQHQLSFIRWPQPFSLKSSWRHCIKAQSPPKRILEDVEQEMGGQPIQADQETKK